MQDDCKVSEPEIARNCFNLLRSGIEELSDPEYQLRVWLGNVDDAQSSYLDASAEILDQPERYELMANHLSDIGLDHHAWTRVLEFSRLLKSFEDSLPAPYNSAEVVKHPDWPSIVSQARAVLALLPKVD